ncbi:ANTAR domain-containing protein [Streptacidiphilus sp. PAMC 29251]
MKRLASGTTRARPSPPTPDGAREYSDRLGRDLDAWAWTPDLDLDSTQPPCDVPTLGCRMTNDRMAEVLRLLELGTGFGAAADVTPVGARALGLDGLTVSLRTGADTTELVWCSDAASRGFEDLQFTLGQGPGPEAAHTGAMVLVPDLARLRHDRWPALGMEAAQLAARAVFCFPMGLGAIRTGVLTAVRLTPGPLSDQQISDAQILAFALTARALDGRQQRPGAADTPHTLQRAVVHQATGMLSVQLDLPLPQALLRLRAHAYSSGRSITDIAQDVVARRLRLDSNGNGDGTPVPVSDKD